MQLDPFTDQAFRQAAQHLQSGRIEDSLKILRGLLSTSRDETTRYLAAREIATVLGAKSDRYLEVGTPENVELQRFMDIAIQTFPLVSPQVQSEMPVVQVTRLKELFRFQEKQADESSRILEELTALQKAYGKERLMILKLAGNTEELLTDMGLRRSSVHRFDDNAFLTDVKALLYELRPIAVVPDFSNLLYILYAHPKSAKSAAARLDTPDVALLKSMGRSMIFSFPLFFVATFIAWLLVGTGGCFFRTIDGVAQGGSGAVDLSAYYREGFYAGMVVLVLSVGIWLAYWIPRSLIVWYKSQR